jgi:xanthine dehydrogenase accessory factor
VKEFQERVLEMMRLRRPFAVATVIGVRGSSSAKPGSKAIINEEGRNIFGWIGGGCAETFICDEATKALAERKTRVVTADLDDEIFGLGMPCGGFMDVYIEPIFPRKRLLIFGHNNVAPALALLAQMAGYEVSVNSADAESAHYPSDVQIITSSVEAIQPDHDACVVLESQGEEYLHALRDALAARVGYIAIAASPAFSQKIFGQLRREGFTSESLSCIRFEQALIPDSQSAEEMALSIVAELLAFDRGRMGKSLREVKKIAPAPLTGTREKSEPCERPELVITGHSRITEELARLGELFKWPTTINFAAAKPEDYSAHTCVINADPNFERLRVSPQTFVVVASHHKGDHLAIHKALKENARYVGLVASRKRSGLILDYLFQAGVQRKDLVRFHAPAGLDLGAVTPEEIALSIMSEMIAVMHAESKVSLRRETWSTVNDDVAVGV